MIVDYIEELKPIADKLNGIDSDLYINLGRNHHSDKFRLVFSSDNQEYRESFERVSKKTGMATGGVAIINYSYLKTKEYPTIGLELYSKGSSFPATEEDIEKVVNFIIEAINDHDKTRK